MASSPPVSPKAATSAFKETDPLLATTSKRSRSDSNSTLIDPTNPSTTSIPTDATSPSTPSTQPSPPPTPPTSTTRNPDHWLGFHPSPQIIVPALFLHVFAMACFYMPFSQFLLLVVCQMLGGSGSPDASTPPSLLMALQGTLSKNHSNPSAWWKGFDPSSFPDYETCAARADVQELTAWWSQIISLATAIPLFILAPVMGTLVDMFGRRTVMILPILSAILGLSSVIAVAQFGFGLWTLVVVHLVQGFMGGQPALITCVYAYLADSSESTKRTEKFLFVDAFMFSAFMFGPAVGGIMARNLGVLFAFYFTLVLDILVLLYIIFILPESNRKKRVTPTTTTTTTTPIPSTPLNPTTPSSSRKSLLELLTVASETSRTLSTMFISAWTTTLQVLAAPGRGWSVRVLALVTAISTMVFSAYQYAFFYYPAKRFGWDSQDAGLFTLVNSVMRVIYLGVILPTLLRLLLAGRTNVGKIRMELTLIRIGLMLYVFGFLAYGLATRGWMFYIIAILDGFGIVALPTIRGILSRTVPSSRQGRLFAALETLQTGMGLLSGIFVPMIYRATIGSQLPQTIFFVVAGIWTLAVVASTWVKSRELVALTPEQDREESREDGEGGEDVQENVVGDVERAAERREGKMRAVGDEEDEERPLMVGSTSSYKGMDVEEVLEAIEQAAEVILDESVRELQP